MEHLDQDFGESFLDDLIEQFESKWLRGDQPDIDTILRRADRFHLQLLVALVNIELEFRLKSGEDVEPTAYFERFPQLLSNPSVAVDLLETTAQLKSRHGPTPPGVFTSAISTRLIDYVDRFPQLEAEIKQRLADDYRAPSNSEIHEAPTLVPIETSNRATMDTTKKAGAAGEVPMPLELSESDSHVASVTTSLFGKLAEEEWASFTRPVSLVFSGQSRSRRFAPGCWQININKIGLASRQKRSRNYHTLTLSQPTTLVYATASITW
jgi:hypothetical protein